MTDATSPEPEALDEFLGTEQPSLVRRYATFWVPAVVLLVLALAVVKCSSGGGKPDYITEAVTQRSLDLTVTATGNLRPTNQVQVGSEVSGRIDRGLVDVNDRGAQGQGLALD